MADAAGPRRTYRSPLREEQAARTHDRIVEAAAMLFSSHGYSGTTMGDVARAAQVSVESVHAAGPKAGLLVEAIRQRYAGDGEWDSLLEIFRAQDEGTKIDDGTDRIVELVAGAHGRSARLMIELRAVAAVEPLVSDQRDDLQGAERGRWTAVAEWMMRATVVPPEHHPEVSADLAATLDVLTSAETFVQLTLDWGLDESQYGAWLGRRIRQLGPEVGTSPP
jgi:AcrR family transcriptional regulator